MIDGKFIVARHGKKEKATAFGETKSSPGDDIDRNQIRITPEGAAEIIETSDGILQGEKYGTGHLTTSNFLRAKESGLYLMSGGSFQEGIHHIAREELGLGANIDNIPGVPTYSDIPEEQDAWLKGIFENFYFSRGPEHPCMGEMHFAMIDSLVKGLEYLQQARVPRMQSVLGNVTHTPSVDTFLMTVFTALDVDPQHRTVRVNDNFRGGARMGEIYSGEIVHLSSTDPSIVAGFKDSTFTFSLSDLKRERAEIADYLGK